MALNCRKHNLRGDRDAIENFLLVGTYGGMLHRMNLASGIRDEYSIGTAPICETGRWIFWKNRDPLHW
ncbi:hypothetical protein M1D70_11950 [Paenibacillus sp. AK002]